MSISRSVQETEAHAACCCAEARPGLVVGLVGDLGAGKTHWARGFARGLGFPGRVHSPTFSLLNTYEGGRLPVYHLDLYRLDSPDQVEAAGLGDYLPSGDGVTLVEWPERWLPSIATRPAPGSNRLRLLWIVTLVCRSEEEREIAHEVVGV